MRMIVVAPGATVRVNGTGIGPSLLTFINGGAVYDVDGKPVTARRGETLSIAADVTLPVTNKTGRELKAMQLMLTAGGEDHDDLADTETYAVAPMFAPAKAALADRRAKDEPALKLAQVV